MSGNPRAIFNYTSVFALLMLLTPGLQAQTPNQLSPQNLSCSPAPCVFPNVMVSQGGYYFTSQTIVANPNNPSQLVVAAQDFNCDNSLMVGVFSSQDGGTSWAHDCVPSQPLETGQGWPIAGYDDNNVLYVGGSEYHNPVQPDPRVVVSSSTDNGMHWSTPVTAIDHANFAWMEVDANPASPFKNTVYVTGTTFHPNTSYFAVSHSVDGGNTWSTQLLDQASTMSLLTGGLAVAKDGVVYVTWTKCKVVSEIGCSTERIFFAKSSDGGNTWSAASEIAITRIGSLAGLGLTFPSYIPAIAVDNSSQPTAGNLYVAFPRFTGKRLQIGVLISKDGGLTWSGPVPVSASKTGDQYQHWINVAADGTVGVTWLDRRQDGYHYQPYYAISRDGGATFGGDQPLSDTLSDPLKVGTTESPWYRTHVWVNNAIYATWPDTRTGNGQIELGGVQF